MASKTNITEDKFNNKWGFIVSCIGSAVGMANIWMFPYRIGEFGGAAFLIPYLIFVVLDFPGSSAKWHSAAPCTPVLSAPSAKHLKCAFQVNQVPRPER